MDENIDKLLAAVKQRYQELGPSSCNKKEFVDHIESLTKWQKDRDYIEVDEGSIVFPEEIHIAYAVCNKECGIMEFIVDGGTQECQYCGGAMFRTDVKKYLLCKDS